MSASERAFYAFINSDDGQATLHHFTGYDLSRERDFFKAGWQARKQLDYELALGIDRARNSEKTRDHATTHEP